jgi:ClpP class serine protease
MLREGQWGEEIMAIEPSAMRGFERRPRARRGEKARSEVAGMTVEWQDGLARLGGVALIQIEGPLSRCAGWWSMGYDEILEAHDEAFRSDARAVLQVIHSPGGYISALDETATEIEAMARKYGKPLHALAADAAYSAAFRLACSASKRWVTRAGGVGSIGVIVTRADWTKFNETMGIRYEQIASGEYKTDGDPDVPVTKEEIARIRERVMYQAGLFFDAAARATGLSAEDVRAQKAALYLGPMAVEAKLTDGVSTLAECVARLEQQTSGRPMVAVPAQGPRGQHSAKGYSMEIGTLITLLGLGASATDQDISARAQGLTGLEGKLREATGKSEPAAMFAAIDGWREGAAKLAEAQGELAKVRDREEKAAYQVLVAQGEASAQITPGNKAKVLERFATSAALSAYLETAPAAIPGRANAGEREAKGEGEKKLGEGSALTWNGKAWAELAPKEQAALHQADQDLYHAMRDAAQKGDSR